MRYQAGSSGHGGIEQRALTAAGFSGDEVKSVYAGNWLRDLSQLPKHPAATVLIRILSMGEFGRDTSADELGTYVPSEHMDNPEGGGTIEDPAVLRGPGRRRRRRSQALAGAARGVRPARRRTAATSSPQRRPAAFPCTSRPASSTPRRSSPRRSSSGRTRRGHARDGRRAARDRGLLLALQLHRGRHHMMRLRPGDEAARRPDEGDPPGHQPGAADAGRSQDGQGRDPVRHLQGRRQRLGEPDRADPVRGRERRAAPGVRGRLDEDGGHHRRGDRPPAGRAGGRRHRRGHRRRRGCRRRYGGRPGRGRRIGRGGRLSRGRGFFGTIGSTAAARSGAQGPAPSPARSRERRRAPRSAATSGARAAGRSARSSGSRSPRSSRRWA